MGDLSVDTAVEGADGTYTAALSADWDIWGPNGGYMAAVAMRAVGAHTEFLRPASFACHFLGVARYEAVRLDVTTLRRTKRAESVRVSMTQDDMPVLEAISWVIGDVEGLSHDAATAPVVPRPQELKTREELLTPEQLAQMYPFWNNVEERAIRWVPEEEWQTRPAGEPVWQHWVRFRPRATFDDPFVDAARLLIALDVCMWPSATQAYAWGELTHIAPSLDLFASFHRMRPGSEWLLVDGFSPFGGDGLVGGQGVVWDEEGKLLVSGGQQMLCRPAPVPAP